jgi:hypothetical protein
MSIPMNSSLGVEQSGKSGGDAVGTGTSGSTAMGGGMGGGGYGYGYGFGSGQGGDATSSSNATGALGGDVSDNTSIGSITINS